ncbi:MAG: hypothetical protein M5U28_30240 [Sandaracinaceae bacterium]|nr:hypothetical protein [Sandaracinaceae bacterium]
MRPWLLLVIMACGAGCGGGSAQVREEERTVPGTFGDDVAFLRAHLPGLVVLERGDARVAIVPEYQGRVMTSSARGEAGRSYGWMNRELIASGRLVPHMNAFGGEDRFWLGPEGGPFALYFPQARPSSSSSGRCRPRSTPSRGPSHRGASTRSCSGTSSR